MSPSMRAATLAALAGLSGACSSSSGGTDSPSPQVPRGTGTVSATGGTVSLPDGPSITAPAGAVGSGDVQVTIRRASQEAPDGAISPLWEFLPSGTTFAKPVTVRIPVPAGTTAATVYWSAESGSGFDVVPSALEGAVAVAQVTHFSTGFVGAVCDLGASCDSGICRVGETVCASGAPVCADGGPVEDGTACGDGRVCAGGTCVAACVTGMPCVPGGAHPCKTYAAVCSTAWTLQRCELSGDRPDGTTCGAGLVCDSGSCVSDARTVSGTWTRAYHPIGSPSVTVPRSAADLAIAAVVGAPASPRIIEGTVAVDGTWSIPGVPRGEYLLRVVHPSSGGPARFIATSADEVGLGDAMLGRADQGAPSATAAVTFELSGLVPWTPASDNLEITSPEAYTVVYSVGPFGFWTPDAGQDLPARATSAAYTNHWEPGGYMNVIDAAKGDTTVIHQLATRSAGSGVDATYVAAAAAGRSSALTVPVGGGATSVAVALSPLDQTGELRFDLRRSAWAARAAQAGPGAELVDFAVAVDANLGPMAPWYPGAGGWPDLLWWGSGPVDADVDLGTLSYGQPFDAPWEEYRTVRVNYAVPVIAPGATSAIRWRVRWSQNDPMPAPTPIVPQLTPPRDVTLSSSIGSRTLAWTAPEVGVPDGYTVTLWAVSADASGNTVRTGLATLDTPHTSATVPAAMVAAGTTCVVELLAWRQAPVAAGSATVGAYAFPDARATTVFGPFTW